MLHLLECHVILHKNANLMFAAVKFHFSILIIDQEKNMMHYFLNNPHNT